MERKRNMYGVSEYLMILAGLEEARLIDRSGKENLPPTGSSPPARDRRICQTNPKEVTTCP
jgi:hypothetical protein